MNLGFRPKKIFFSTEFIVDDPFYSLKYVNGVSKAWTGFTGSALGKNVDGSITLNKSTSSIPEIRSYNFEQSDIFIASYTDTGNVTAYTITLSYKNGVALFSQNCYFNTSSHSATIAKQSSSYSMNVNKTVYYYLAIG